MAKQNEALFEESSQGAVSAVTAVAFVLSLVLMVGGMVLSGYAFTSEAPDMLIFASGLGAMILSFVLPFTILPAIGK